MNKNTKEHLAHIDNNQYLGGRYYLLTLSFEQAFAQCTGGEFVMLECDFQQGQVLRRPMAVFKQDVQSNTIDILYQTVGVGTRSLCQRKVGETIQLLGPLGNAFPNIEKQNNLAVVAGGIGTAPFLQYLLHRPQLKAQNYQLYFGFRNDEEARAIENIFNEHNLNCTIYTDHKSKHYPQGLILEAYQKQAKLQAFDNCFTCGPNVMMNAVHDFHTQHNIATQTFASAEAKMACGMGVCLSCIIDEKDLSIGQRKLVCTDGPIFELQS